jgi:hypothetical protein
VAADPARRLRVALHRRVDGHDRRLKCASGPASRVDQAPPRRAHCPRDGACPPAPDAFSRGSRSVCSP